MPIWNVKNIQYYATVQAEAQAFTIPVRLWDMDPGHVEKASRLQVRENIHPGNPHRMQFFPIFGSKA